MKRPPFHQIFRMRDLVFLVCLASWSEAAHPIEIRIDLVVKQGLARGAAGANLCWLLDSDKKNTRARSVKDAAAELGLGALRFPFGHLADNYLWHSPTSKTSGGTLRPKVASLDMIPGKWEWAVDQDGSFKNAMDFDEFSELCDSLRIQPLVCVNMLSFKYPNGPSREDIIRSAVEWVKYAKSKNRRVAYWQLGNEVDHPENRKFLSPEEFVALYREMAAVMKKADPSIRIGPGILNNIGYYRALADTCPEAVDFASVHQYMFGFVKTCSNYASWKEDSENYVRNVTNVGAFVEQFLPGVPLLVTETGTTGAGGQINNLFKALWWFEILMNELMVKNVAYTFYWGLHNPWFGPEEKNYQENDDSAALRLDDNAPKPTGMVIKLVNENLLDGFISVDRAAGYLRIYVSHSTEKDKLNLFILNKNDREDRVSVRMPTFKPAAISSRKVFTGKSPNDRSPQIRSEKPPSLENGAFEAVLPPYSVTVFEIRR